jgi:hypothetical protein
MKEENLQIQVCKYLDLQYKDIVYTSDLSGVRLTIGQAVKAKKERSKRYKIPDLLILQPNDKYCGLIMELKTDKSKVFGKKGQLLKNGHVEDQIKSLHKLHSVGYFATFVFSFEMAKKTIDDYLNNRQPYMIIDKL